MREIVDVNTGEIKIARGQIILRSIAIGSCVVVAAYDSRKKIGVMAHIMLPGSAPKNNDLGKTKYAAEAIDKMLNKMAEAGSQGSDIQACLVGAGNVLKKEDDTVCKDNIESTTRLLKEKGIPVRAAVLGGVQRKGVFLDAESGSITYTEGDKEEKLLWKPTESTDSAVTIAGSASEPEGTEGE